MGAAHALVPPFAHSGLRTHVHITNAMLIRMGSQCIAWHRAATLAIVRTAPHSQLDPEQQDAAIIIKCGSLGPRAFAPLPGAALSPCGESDEGVIYWRVGEALRAPFRDDVLVVAGP